MSPYEAAMIICFGVSWPVAIWKTIKTKHVHGKSLTFLALVASGYGFGMIHKAVNNFDWVIFLYAFNFLMVLAEIGLCLFYGKQNRSGLFDANATVEALFDDEEMDRPALRLISVNDEETCEAQPEEHHNDYQLRLVQKLRKHGW